MGPLFVVPPQILGDLLAPHHEVSRQAGETFILDGPIESFEMSVVVRLPDAGMPVRHAQMDDLFREPLRELGSMIGLKRAERERSNRPSRLHKGEALVGVDPERWRRVRPAGTDIKECVHTETIRWHPIEDGINLHEHSGDGRNRSRWIPVPLLPA